MFYRTSEDHGLKYNPLKAIIAPRPIAWVSTRDANGRDNLAPYSFFQAMQDTPPVLGFSSGHKKPGFETGKDSVANIKETKQFAVNIVPFAMRDAMNVSSAHFEHGVDEFDQAGLEKVAAQAVDVSLVKGVPVSMECRLRDVITLDEADWVIGDVVAIHIEDQYIVDGKLDVTKYEPLARLGYKDYAKIDNVFALERPKA